MNSRPCRYLAFILPVLLTISLSALAQDSLPEGASPPSSNGSAASDKPTTIPAPGLPFSLVFRAEPGKEDILLKIASAYEAASKRRVPPPAFGPLPAKTPQKEFR